MIWVFLVVLVVTSAVFLWKKAVGRKTWVALVLFAILFSFVAAYISVSNVWTPSPLSDDVFRAQDKHGNFNGTLPLSQLSYPISLTVFHTPFQQVTLDQNGYYAHGKAEFNVTFTNFNFLQVNGNYSYLYPIMGPSPLIYEIDSVFNNGPEFFGSLVALFTVFNCFAAFAAIILATVSKRTLEHAKSKTKKG
jgi:hypothetical protein